MSLFTRLSAAVKTFNADVDTKVVKVVRGMTPIEVEPGYTALESACTADLLTDDQENIASFQIKNVDGSEEFVGANYICQGGQTLVVSVNRDGKGIN